MFGLAQGTVGYNVVLSALISVGANVIGYVITTITKTHKITDLIGTGVFAVMAWSTQAAAMHGHGLSVVEYKKPLFLTIGVTFWAVRLAGFLFYRVLQTGTDKRFDMFIPNDDEPWLTGPTKFPLKLGAFWLVQSLWSFTVLLPVTVAQAYRPTASMGAWGWTGFALFMFFFAYEATADFQKTIFKNKPENKGKFMNEGLFRFSQFPNYFAEISVWWVMFFWAGFGPNVFAGKHAYIILSPLLTTVLLRWGSGVANLKASQEERYGSQPEYREYTASTPLLFPFMKPFYADRKPHEALMDAPESSSSVEHGRGGSGDRQDSK